MRVMPIKPNSGANVSFKLKNSEQETVTKPNTKMNKDEGAIKDTYIKYQIPNDGKGQE